MILSTRSGGETFRRNLTALARSSPVLAARLEEVSARDDARFIDSEESAPALVLGGSFVNPTQVQLTSRRRPLEEAERLASTVDPGAVGVVVVLGFGAGYHVAALARSMKRAGIILVFEPDLGLLRAVFERIDCSDWLSSSNVAIFHDAEDVPSLAAATQGVEGVFAVGVKVLDHPPSRARLAADAERFVGAFATVMRAVRTSVVTTLVQVDVTLRNYFQNLDRYATAPGIADLKNAASGRPAVVVAAGPSLERNLHLLARPGVRDRVVIIAVQTVLKAMLERGIRPHFVTALDYHEVSRRFYEGLTEADVEGVTLVVEPKANPAILEAFPGAIRCPAEPLLDDLLGPDLSRDMGRLPPGATVAHLAYFLARHLGCDPVILIGQDLGFTDGQYYAANAAIHTVWSGELSEFRTLEMMELERILRFGKLLTRKQDVLGRPILTDEQMSTYLVQFEREFLADSRAGRTVIDATEGGVAKAHTRVATLADALARYAAGEPISLPPTPAPRAREATLGRVTDRVRGVLRDVRSIARASRDARGLLDEMLEVHPDQQALGRLIERLDRIKEKVVSLRPAYGIVHFLNQTGALNRFKADRAIELDPNRSEVELQRLQIERDRVNVSWLADAADHLASLLEAGLATMAGAARLTRDPPPRREWLAQAGLAEKADGARRTVAAVLLADPERGGLGTARDLGAPFRGSDSLLKATLARLARAEGIDRVLVLTPDPRRIRELAGEMCAGHPVEIIAVDGARLRAHQDSLRGARLWCRAAWRGGLGGLSAFDEAFCAPLFAPVMRERSIDAAAVLGADWALVDPSLVGAAIARHRERPDANQLCFTQAPPGLGVAVIDRALVEELAAQADAAGPFATIGGLIGFVPVAPQLDPITRPACITVEPAVRDLGARLIPDTPESLVRFASALAGLPAEANASMIAAVLARSPAPAAKVIHLDVTTAEGAPIALSVLTRLLESLPAGGAPALTLGVEGDPLLHPELPRIVELARLAGAAGVHIRTRLGGGVEMLQRLFACAPEVVSVDLLADTPETYRALTGGDGYEVAATNLRILSARRGAGMPRMWVVPRLTRCDAVYPEIEPFYTRWLMECGACIIDPLPAPRAGERIAPLPLPEPARRRQAGSVWRLSANTVAASIGPQLLRASA